MLKGISQWWGVECKLNKRHLTIILNLFICLSGNSQIIRPKELKFSGFDEGHPGDVITKFGEDRFFANSSQTIGPKGLNYAGFNEGHPGVVIRNFGEDQSKTLPMGLFSPKISWLWSQLYA